MSNRPTATATDDNQRCTRSDSKGWRCPLPRFGGTLYCEKHYLWRKDYKSQSKKKRKGRRPSEKRNNIKWRFQCREEDWNTDEDEEEEEEEDEEEWSSDEEDYDKNKKSRTETEEGSEWAGEMRVGQIWAFSQESDDGFPKSYARIDRIVKTQSSAHVTPLVPYPVSGDEAEFTQKGLSLACGMFRPGDSTLVKNVSEFSHNVRFEGGGRRNQNQNQNQNSLYRIFPREGEIWAVYLEWDDSNKRFEYKLVEVVSDFDEADGVNVYGLIQVEGMDGVYQRHVHQGFQLVRNYSTSFLPMFSHRVPADTIQEDNGVILWKATLH